MSDYVKTNSQMSGFKNLPSSLYENNKTKASNLLNL